MDTQRARQLIVTGCALEHQGAFEAAESCYRRAAEEGSTVYAAMARTRLAVLLLGRGDFAHGLPLFESRGAGPEPSSLRWGAQRLNGETVIVTSEREDEGEGLGDHIQFARWLPAIKARGAGRVIYSMSRERRPLARLFASIPGIDVEIARPLSLEDVEAILDTPPRGLHVRACSLPFILGARPHSIPAPPYLKSDSDDVERWRSRLPDAPLRVGLVWRGSPNNPEDTWRSLPGLATLAPLWQAPGVAFVSLQKGAGEDEARIGLPGQSLTHLGSEQRDFADSAAILEQLDLLISVDTSTAHLGGALGKPVWLLADKVPDWRWRDEDLARRWYPTVRIFRQHVQGDWNGAIEDMTAALMERAEAI